MSHLVKQKNVKMKNLSPIKTALQRMCIAFEENVQMKNYYGQEDRNCDLVVRKSTVKQGIHSDIGFSQNTNETVDIFYDDMDKRTVDNYLAGVGDHYAIASTEEVLRQMGRLAYSTWSETEEQIECHITLNEW